MPTSTRSPSPPSIDRARRRTHRGDPQARRPARPPSPRGPLLNVLGVDPGSNVTGYGILSRSATGLVLVECGVIRTSSRAPLAERLRDIFEGITSVIERHGPAAVAVEGVFYGKNPRSTAVLGHARGVVLLAAARAGLEVAEYPPAEVKSAVAGTGRATKEQVGRMVATLLKLSEPPKPDDAADAVAIALCHCYRGRRAGTAAAPQRFSLRGLAAARGIL